MARATPLPPGQRRAAIIAATEPLLEIHGRAVSTRQIAEAAGVAEGTIFRVFPTKDELIDAVIAEAFDISTSCNAIARIDPELDLASRLVAVVDILQTRLRRVFALFHSVTLRPPPESQEAFHARLRRDNAALNEVITEVIGPDEPQLRVEADAAAALLRTLTFAVTHPMLADERHSAPEQVVEVLLYGITNRAALNCPPHPVRRTAPETQEEPC